MASWKKIIVSGSAAELSSLTLDTALAVAQGGTGASTLTDGGVLLGSGTGAITATAVLTDGQMLVGDGTTDPAIESGATLRTSIGVGTGDSPQFTDLTLTGGNITLTGGATDIDVIDNNASALSIDASGKAGILEIDSTNSKEQVKMSGGLFVTGNITGSGAVSASSIVTDTLTLDTALAVAQGGTGATSLTDGGVLLGSGTGAITATSVLGDGEMLVGDASGDPSVESGATLRTSIGVGTGDSPQFTNLTLTGGEITLTGGATDIDLIDNNSSALSFDAAGKAGILEIDTTNSGEGVKMSGDLTVEGNFVVNGNTTNANVANLLVEDRFILLNSGSASGDGGLIVQSGSATAMSGAAFVFDQNVERWGVQTDVALGSIATTSSPEAYQVNYVLNANTGSATYNVKGNLKIDDSNGDIFIYS